MDKVNIYYFSGTGNSLYIARELQKRLPEVTLIPMLSLLENESIIPDAEIIGLVFPIYLTSLPAPVKQFIGKIRLKQEQYIFSLTTHCGYPGRVDRELDELLVKRGKGIDCYFAIKMLVNTPKGLVPSFMIKQKWASQITAEAISDLDAQANKAIDNSVAFILKKGKNAGAYDANPPGFFSMKLKKIIDYITNKFTAGKPIEIGFYADASCNGCGICEKVCLSHKIKMENGKPLWQKDIHCYYCYACFNLCPEQAILVKNYTKKDGRYIHPGISMDDISKQKKSLIL